MVFLRGRLRAKGRMLPPSPPASAGTTIALYDAEGTDHSLAVSDVSPDRLNDRQLLWIDMTPARDVAAVAAALGLAPDTVAGLDAAAPEPALFVHDGYVHVVAVAPGDVPGGRPSVLHCIVGPNWIVTAHDHAIAFLDKFGERIRGDSALGGITSHEFLAAILEEHVTNYFAELHSIEAGLDRLDLTVLAGRVDEDDLLRELVASRLRLAKLRRLLAPHRELVAVLSRAEFRVLAGTDSDDPFERLGELLERALQGMETTRDAIVGSFDIYTTRVAHGANKVMKLLTVVSVTLLMPTLLAGVMGMNSLPRFLSSGSVFAVTILAMLGLALGTLAIARARSWI
jgi:magnesium transporter